LLVDDDAFNLNTLKLLITRKYSYIECECAMNGELALEILEHKDYKFELIIMDY